MARIIVRPNSLISPSSIIAGSNSGVPSIITGSGALSSPSSLIAGAGARHVSGAGALVSPSSAVAGNGGGFQTSFPNAENPLSQGGIWVQGGSVGNLWTNTRCTTGRVFGTQTGSGGFNDSVSILKGFSPNQSAEGTIVFGSPVAAFQEVEVWLRAVITANSIKGYEINLADSGSYLTIVRWNGGFGQFTQLAEINGLAQPTTGFRLYAQIIGTVIVVKYDSGSGYVVVLTYDTVNDSTKYSVGNPGLGFYIESGTTNNAYGFSSFKALNL